MIPRIPDRASIDRSPPQRSGRIFGCVYDVQREITSKKEKTPQRPAVVSSYRGNSGVRQFGAFPPHLTNVNQLTGLTTGPIPGVEHKIISSIETFRKKN